MKFVGTSCQPYMDAPKLTATSLRWSKGVKEIAGNEWVMVQVFQLIEVIQ